MRRRHRIYQIPRAIEPSRNTSIVSTALSGTSTTTATMARHDSKELSSTSKAVIGSVTSCLGVAILIILGVYFYGRRRHKYSTENPGFVFDKDVFVKPASSPQSNTYAIELTKLNSSSTLSPVRYREPPSKYTFDDNTAHRKSFLDIGKDEKIAIPTLAFPKPLVEKKGRIPRGKPTWLSPITTKEEVKSSPLTYDGQEILISIPPQTPPHNSKATPMSPTSPVTRQSCVPVKSKISRQSLTIPDFEPPSVISPARSESFASKDLVPPSPITPASSTSGSNLAGSQIASSHVEHYKDAELPRLMNVVALYTPNLPDELHVKIGDAVRIIEEYKDGWCFAQLLGKKDAPKGVVPLVCLQERERLLQTKHRSSNKSLTSLNWRCTNG